MKKKLCILLLALACLTVLTGCCSHEWLDATCEDPQICSKCEEIQGNPLGHDMADADCVNPRTCTRCGLLSCCMPPRQTGPTVWMMYLLGRR